MNKIDLLDTAIQDVERRMRFVQQALADARSSLTKGNIDGVLGSMLMLQTHIKPVVTIVDATILLGEG